MKLERFGKLIIISNKFDKESSIKYDALTFGPGVVGFLN
jgi:hypothetical protein